MKLSEAQQRTLNKMEIGIWVSAYELQESLATLDALHKKGFVEMRAGLGAIFDPRVNVIYKRLE